MKCGTVNLCWNYCAKKGSVYLDGHLFHIWWAGEREREIERNHAGCCFALRSTDDFFLGNGFSTTVNPWKWCENIRMSNVIRWRINERCAWNQLILRCRSKWIFYSKSMRAFVIFPQNRMCWPWFTLCIRSLRLICFSVDLFQRTGETFNE